MFSTSSFACNHLPAIIAILAFIIAVTIARLVLRFQSKSVPREWPSSKQLDSSYFSSQQHNQFSNLKLSSAQLLAIPQATKDLPIGDCLPGCAHAVLNYPTFLPVQLHQKTTHNNHIQSFAKQHLSSVSQFISGLTHSHVYGHVRQMIFPDVPTNAPSIPLKYQRHLFPGNLQYAGEMC